MDPGQWNFGMEQMNLVPLPWGELLQGHPPPPMTSMSRSRPSSSGAGFGQILSISDGDDTLVRLIQNMLVPLNNAKKQTIAFRTVLTNTTSQNLAMTSTNNVVTLRLLNSFERMTD